MADMCFITTCMGRLTHLRQTLGHAVAQLRGSCVVVDYSCPEQCGDWVERFHPRAKVVRLPGQTRFQLAHARNLGARAADAPWLCFFDADIDLDPSFADVVLRLLQPGGFYLAEPLSKGLGGTVVCARDDFDRAGGYDEVMQGWGCEDDDLYARFGLLGLARLGFPARLVRQLTHADNVRVQFYDTKDRRISHAINSLYTGVKFDLMRLSGQFLPLEERRTLYRRVEEFSRQALDGSREGQLQIDFRRQEMPFGWESTGKLTYSLTKRLE